MYAEELYAEELQAERLCVEELHTEKLQAERLCVEELHAEELYRKKLYGKEPPLENRMRIMECAKELFYAKGYDAVGVQEIVDRAGITKPTLYYYFGSKIGLLKTLLATKFEEAHIFGQTAFEPGLNIRTTLYELAETYFDFFEKDREFYMLMMALFYSARENEAYQAVKPYVTAFYETVVSVFDCASWQLGNMNGRQRQFAIGFIGTINHYLLLHCETDPDHHEAIEKERIISLVNQFMYGIFT